MFWLDYKFCLVNLIKIFNFVPLLEKEIYTSLKDIDFFLKAKVIGDTVGWNDDINIAPEHLYEYGNPL